MILWEFSTTYFDDIHHLPLLQISPKFNSSSVPYPPSLYVIKKKNTTSFSRCHCPLDLRVFSVPSSTVFLSLGCWCRTADISDGAGHLIASCQRFDQLWLPVTVSICCKEMPLWSEDKCALTLPHFFFEVLFTQTGSGKFKLTFFYLLSTAWWWSMFPQEICKLGQKYDTINSTISL